MKTSRIIIPLIIILAATAYFSIFIVKEINQYFDEFDLK